MSLPRIYFVSGYRDITAEEFQTHYERKIRASNAQHPNCIYFVGNNQGCDQIATHFLRKIGVAPERVIIHYRETDTLINDYKSMVRSFASHKEKNIFMTCYSTHDIIWLRPDDNDSEIAVNFARRRQKLKKPRNKRARN